MKYIVIENHRTEFPDPIILKQGEKVIIGEESANWPNWVFCTKSDGSNKGWIPKQIINSESDYGNITEDYSAKELDIDIGTIVEGMRELNDWLWLKNKKTNEIGWVPVKKLRKLE
ncbi:MAG: hypothetical protein LBL05_08330 [Synergistaceae bacterium]|jgi:hypothetical protein|nr:hypothetical protein [Synergistaceae bacterium]